MDYALFSISKHVLRCLNRIIRRFGIEFLAMSFFLFGLLDTLLIVSLVGPLFRLTIEHYLVYMDLLIWSRNITPLIRLIKQGCLDKHLEVLGGISLLRIKLTVFLLSILHELELVKRYIDCATHWRINDEDHLFAIIRWLIFGPLLSLDLVRFRILTVQNKLFSLLFEFLLPFLLFAQFFLHLFLFVYFDKIFFRYIAEFFIWFIVFEVLSHLLDFTQIGV